MGRLDLRRRKAMVAAIALLSVGLSATAHAVPINITIPDTSNNGSNPAVAANWYSNREDQEVEPGCVTTQPWDLEAFVLDGNTLTLYGGYNIAAPPTGGAPGDIFIDTNGDAVYGQDIFIDPAKTSNTNYYNTINNSQYHWDYVIDLQTNGAYNVYALSNSSLVTVYYRINDESNPWRFVLDTENPEQKVATGTFTVTNLGSGNITPAAGTTLTGGTHYATSFDLGFLPGGSSFTTKFTMECGNDNIIGKGRTQVPEPGTLLLLGTGLLGLGLLRRRKVRS